jgi:predicted metal-dependent phosphoesterase TrpH
MRIEVYDLHCHSTASDGALSPGELVQRAYHQGVTALALTDHDTTQGLAEAQQTAQLLGLRLIPGIELSTNWQNKCLHIIGLGIDPTYPPLADATQNLQNVRLLRAEKMAEKLAQKGIGGALEAVKKAAGEGMITRTHFADFLVSQFHVDSQQKAFDRYLAKGKLAYVATPWAELEQAVGWITQSGGVAVLAHPLRYGLTASWMRRLLEGFKQMGGQGIEVVTGRYNADEIKLVADYAKRFELAGSVGSDFHSPENQWVELGRLAAMPQEVLPIWTLLG